MHSTAHAFLVVVMFANGAMAQGTKPSLETHPAKPEVGGSCCVSIASAKSGDEWAWTIWRAGADGIAVSETEGVKASGSLALLTDLKGATYVVQATRKIKDGSSETLVCVIQPRAMRKAQLSEELPNSEVAHLDVSGAVGTVLAVLRENREDRRALSELGKELSREVRSEERLKYEGQLREYLQEQVRLELEPPRPAPQKSVSAPAPRRGLLRGLFR